MSERLAWLTRSACLVVAMAGCHHVYHPGIDGPGLDLAVEVSPDLSPDCEGNLRCQIATCPSGGKTRITGTVYAPNGTLPLYNATVYIPTAPVDPFPAGVTCDRCDGHVSGNPIAVTLTGADGGFVLDNVPSGENIPLVIELGRWRRQVTLPSVTSCTTNQVTDSSLTRLPRTRAEGDIPHMAIATGGADPMECLLLKIGIDPSEITAPAAVDSGRVHFYVATDAPGTDLASHAPRANVLYSSLANLLQYDVVMLPCEGGAYDKSQVDGVPLTPDPRVLFQQYLDVGGRVFATHLSYDWYTYENSPYNRISQPVNGLGQWPVGQPDDYNDTIHGTIDQSVPKGGAFAQWLKFAGAVSAMGQLDIAQGRHDLTGVDPTLAQTWVTHNFAPQQSGPAVMHMTFNTPLDAPVDDMGTQAYCGRTVFSDFHVTATALQSASLPFPQACKQEALTDQEKALAFMLFDLTSCVQSDSSVPVL
jgi:hypothetical protein